MKTQDKFLGVFTSFDALEPIEKELVTGTWAVAENAYIPRSNFPVGAIILAQNDAGQTKTFAGCNVENRFFTPTICAERSAIVAAVAAGYRKLLKIALVCKRYQGPGAICCGLCRQVVAEFGWNADVFSMADANSNVYKFRAGEMLPAAGGDLIPFNQLALPEKRLVDRLMALVSKSYVPYSKVPQAAMFSANNERGTRRTFAGIADDNASYGGSALAACVAMRSARTAGYSQKVMLALSVKDPKAVNPVEGECLQVLREFGLEGQVLLVGEDRSLVRTNLEELMPDSFGPQSIA